MKLSKKWLLTSAAAVWTGLWAINAAPTQISNAIGWLSGATLWLIDLTKNSVENIINSVPGAEASIWAFAPWAVPGVVGWMLWNKYFRIWDALDIENKVIRWAFNFTGTWLWAAWGIAAATAFPLIWWLTTVATAWLVGYLGYKWVKKVWNGGKNLIWKTS